MQAGVHIGSVAAEQLEAALQLVFVDMEPEDRAERVAAVLGEQGSAGPPEGLVGANEGADLVGAVFWQILPGRVGALVPPRVIGKNRPGVAHELLQTACDQLARRGVCMIQCLLRRQDVDDLELLQSAGFEPFGDLYYLVSVVADFPQSAPSTELSFEPCTPGTHASFGAVVEATSS